MTFSGFYYPVSMAARCGCFLFVISACCYTEVTDGLLKRILPHGKDASRFTCVIDGSHSGKDWFAISCDGQTVSIKGPNNVSLAAGINWFLNKYKY